MQTRTLGWTLVALMAMSATVVAQTNDSNTTSTSPDAANASYAWGLRVDPAAQPIKAGGEARYVLYAKSTFETTLSLAIGRHAGDGYDAKLDPATIALPAGGEAKALFVIRANESPSAYAGYQIVATASDGSNRSVVVKAELVRPAPTPTPAPAPKPVPEPAAQTFALVATPTFSGIHPGGDATFTIHARSAKAQTLKLGVGARVEQGYLAKLTNETLTAGDGEPAETTLLVHAAENATTRFAKFEVWAYSASGERHAIGVSTELLRATADEPTKPTPIAGDPRPVAQDPAAPRPEPAAPGIEIAFEGFDGGVVKLSIKIGDGKIVHFRIHPSLLKASTRADGVGDDVGHHSPLWMRLELGNDEE